MFSSLIHKPYNLRECCCLQEHCCLSWRSQHRSAGFKSTSRVWISKMSTMFVSILTFWFWTGVCSLVAQMQTTIDMIMLGFSAGLPVRIMDKCLVDFIFLCGLEVATLRGLPMQIHTGYFCTFCALQKNAIFVSCLVKAIMFCFLQGSLYSKIHCNFSKF